MADTHLLRLSVIMNFVGCRNILGLLLLIAALFSLACDLTATPSIEAPKPAAQTGRTNPETAETPFVKPFTPIEAGKFTGGLRRSWQRFTASGYLAY